jgi:hypothetical protein
MCLQTSFRDSPSQRSSLRWFFHRRSLGPLRFQSAYSGMVGQHGKYSLDCAYYRLWFLHRRHNHTIQCSAQLSRDRIPSVRGIDICRERTFRRLVRRDLPTFCKLHIKPVLIRAAANHRCRQARRLFRKLGIGPGNSLLGGIAVCFMPLPYIFYRVSPSGRIDKVETLS